MTIILPFDSHNHVHMGPTNPLRALFGVPSPSAPPENPGQKSVAVRGMAIMSTHRRDYQRVQSLAKEIPHQYPQVSIVPCFGVHPWWLHELTEQDWDTKDSPPPRWIQELEELLIAHPEATVGETGLDAFHFHPVTKDLMSPMDRQINAFQLQMQLAARHQRPVSIHCVQAMGPLMKILSQLKKSKQLPPAIYFHAFGGKSGTVDQIAALCHGTKFYFGFAPVVNFRSPKTAQVVRHVTIERLLLETDHEDAALVPDSIQAGIQFYAQALGLDESEIVERTTANALEFYGIQESS